jgi:hypothetical protein
MEEMRSREKIRREGMQTRTRLAAYKEKRSAVRTRNWEDWLEEVRLLHHSHLPACCIAPSPGCQMHCPLSRLVAALSLPGYVDRVGCRQVNVF